MKTALTIGVIATVVYSCAIVIQEYHQSLQPPLPLEILSAPRLLPPKPAPIPNDLQRVSFHNEKFPLRAPNFGEWVTDSAFPGVTFDQPLCVAFAPGEDRRAYVLEKKGRLWAVSIAEANRDKLLVLDLTAQVSSQDPEEGAFSLVFHPEFATPDAPGARSFFLFYTALAEGGRTDRLSRFQLSADGSNVDLATELILIDQFDEGPWHNAGALQFGPDGFLYVAVGDEGAAFDGFGNTQTIRRDLFSGILRLDVDQRGGKISHPPRRQPETGRTAHYFIPNDNPWVDVTGVLEEFWAIGLRNPYRMSFDRETGDLWVGDVGQDEKEEINRIVRGGNYEWSYKEGQRPLRKGDQKSLPPANPLGMPQGPIYDYPHGNGNGCIIGGYVYRGTKFPELRGSLIYGDNIFGRIWGLREPGTPQQTNMLLTQLPFGQLTSLAETPEGELLFCLMDGDICELQRVAAGEHAPLPEQLSETGLFADLTTLTPAAGLIPYAVNSPLWSDGAEKHRWIALPGDGQHADPTRDRIGFAATGAWQFPPGTLFVKHFELPQGDRVQRLETRVLVQTEVEGVYGVTYRWNESQTDAALVHSGRSDVVTIGDVTKDETQEWYFPGSADCRSCHTPEAGYVLGVNTRQLNRAISDVGDSPNQLDVWGAAGLFREPWSPGQAKQFAKLVAPDDSKASIQDRARSYLDANCAHCHRPGSPVRARFDARHDTPIHDQRLVNGAVMNPLDIVGAVLVSPGSPDKSILLKRMTIQYPGMRMPFLASNVIDRRGVSVLSQWVKGLSLDAGTAKAPTDWPIVYAARFDSDSFTSGQLVRSPGHSSAAAESTANGLELKIPSQVDGLALVGAGPPLELVGDFELTAGYEIGPVTRPEKGFGAGATLFVAAAMNEQGVAHSANFDVIVHPKDGWQRSPKHWINTNGKSTGESQRLPINGEHRRGFMRLVRLGSGLHYQFRDDLQQPFSEFYQVDFDDQPLQRISLSAHNGGGGEEVTVVWKDLRIRQPQPLESVASTIASGTRSLAAEFKECLTDGELDAERWEMQGDRSRSKILSTAEGLQLFIPAETDQRVFVGPVPLISLEGDFEITAEFVLPEEMPRQAVMGRSPSFNLFIAAAKHAQHGRSSASVGWTARPDGPAFEANQWLSHRQKVTATHHHDPAPVSLQSGQLRLQRTGSRLQFFIAENDSAEFRQIQECEFVRDDIDKIHLAVHGGGGVVSEVIWRNFSVQADRTTVRSPTAK